MMRPIVPSRLMLHHLVGFGEPALRVVSGSHRQQPHDQPHGRSRDQGPGPEAADQCDGNARR